MVITKLYGGLGNQMFQYATGLALAHRLDAELYLDVTWYRRTRTNQNITQRTYALGGFGIKTRHMPRGRRLHTKLRRPTLFRETAFQYDPAFERLEGDVILDGYWQSFRYFESSASDICSRFRFPADGVPTNTVRLRQIQAINSVAVQFRRGDYTSLRGQAYHRLMPLSYYRAAIATIADQVGDVTLFIFSDDIPWCRANLKFDQPIVFIDSDASTRDLDHMHLMSACKHMVIANSSFSWWAAWLNQNPGKLICAPDRWFVDEFDVINDRLPPEWRRL
jgi:hypothetical protein